MKRLTVLKNAFPQLKNKMHIEKAISTLFDYENTGLTAYEIHELMQTANKLRERVKLLEDYQWNQ